MTRTTAYRTPAVSGSFYPAEPDRLRALVVSLLSPGTQQEPAMAVIAPHAGYQYSGKTAGAVYARVIIPDRIILVGPNHRGLGPPICVYSGGPWQTPLGTVPVDAELSEGLLKTIPGAEGESYPHANEHSLEVHLPFLQVRRETFRASFIILGDLDLETTRTVGNAIAEVIRHQAPGTLMVASTDLSHYFPDREARRRDARAVDAICARDESALYERVYRENINMCGFIATAGVIRAANALGATRATLVDYRTSADASGDFSAVVGYAGIILQ